MLCVAFAYATTTWSQVPVQVGPEPKTQFLNSVGAPLSGGIVCTYAAGTSTPQATYTDSTGTVQNTNPIVLNSAGRANIWWQSAAYKVVLAAGGTCGSPSGLQWTVDNFQVGIFLTGNNTFSGNNTFNGTTTFNGPVNMNAGGSMNGTFSGNPNFSGSPTFTGTIVANQFQSTVGTGTPPLIVASTTKVTNLNVDQLDGCDWAIPCPIGSTTPNTAVFTTMNAQTSATINGVTISGTPTANQVITASSPTVAGWASIPQTIPAVYSNNVSGITVTTGTTTIATQAVVFPATGGPFRVFISYSLLQHNSVNNRTMTVWVDDGTNQMGATETGVSNSGIGTSSFGGFSSVDYQNSDSKTFTLKGVMNSDTTDIAATPATGSGHSTYQITVIPSVN